ncbi:hypothetical protein A1353_11800 [Methylomonas methanica]|uniref:FUN14 family protein n=1 Tax=Methylomonas methanica TaxID=421 RepID=A0A177MIR9_METMH|nr:FUN14 domain-containing protein [Methylomonas methanica]OAI05255.1 hypothetical protein A1353_11800 [Methylomonas methanica]
MSNAIETYAADDIFSEAFLLGNLGAPFILGMAVGYFAKKMLRTALFIGGAIVSILFLAEYYDLININNMALENAANSAAEVAKESGSFLLDRLAVFTSRGVSGAGGFFVGFKLG